MSRRITSPLIRPIFLSALLLAGAWAAARLPVTVQASEGALPVRQGLTIGNGPNRAGLVVRFDDGRTDSICVSFSESEIGGDELINRSGLTDIIFSDEGALCGIEGQGCPPDDCFCKCTNLQDCTYWAYYSRKGDAWSYSQLGAMYTVVRNGDLQAWSWGEGDFKQGVPPPDKTFEQVCVAANGTENTPTPTPTPTPTATNMPPGNAGQDVPPQATFYATLQSIAPNQCTMLNWETIDATAVTLDGAAVTLSGSQQVCPTGDQTWTLQASNSVDRVSRQVSIRVTAAVASQPTSTPSLPAAVNTPNQPAVRATPAVAPTSRPIITQGPPPLATSGQQSFVPTPGIAASSARPGGLAGGGVPLAPTAEPLPVLTSTPLTTPTRYVFSALATETPRPRRALGEGGRPTPTPILLARAASGGSSQAPAARTGNSLAAGMGEREKLVSSRAFKPALLPQYAAYVATMAVLLAMAWYVLRRRHRSAPGPVRQSDSK